MDFITYTEQLGLGIDDEYKQQSFLNKMYNFISNSKIELSHSEEAVFASEIGMRYRPRYTNDVYQYLIEELSNVWHYIDAYREFRYKLATIVTLVNYLSKRERIEDFNIVYGWMKYALETSHILYQEESYDGEVFIFPKGDHLLDKGEILTPLKLLDDYPESKQSFIVALKEYNDLDESNASAVADQFRKALESFFQEFFDSNKSLENFKSEYGSFLQRNGIPSELSSNFVSLLNSYTNYNNNYAKHHDKTSKLALEYLLYETGNIIRLLISLKDNEMTGKS